VKKKVRTLVGDPDQDWVTDDYILPFVAIEYENAINYLANTCSPFMTQRIQIPDIPAGTTDFTPYQVAPTTGLQASGQAGAPLMGLITPLHLWYKQAGQPPNNYALAEEAKDIPFIAPGNYIPGQRAWWQWISNKIIVTPLGFATDWLVEGEFFPPALVDDDDYVQVDPAMTSALAFAVASTIGGERVNATYISNWGQRAQMAYDDISARLTRKEQSTPQRVGRMGGKDRGRGCH
jgi:hypothetical protein